MTRWTIEVDEDVAERVAQVAAERGIAPEALAADTVADSFPPRRRLSFIGMGHSGGGESIAERHEEIIREHFSKKTAGDV